MDEVAVRPRTAAVLAGGLGTRLARVNGPRPKVLADVLGRPFLAFLLDSLAAAGVERVVLCTGYRGEQVRAYFGDAYRGLGLVYSREPVPLGTAGALRLALPFLADDPVLVANGDSYCHADLGALWTAHRASHAAATLLLTEVADTARYGSVAVDDEGRVVRFAEKASAGPGWISAGVYLLSRRFIEGIEPGKAVSLECEVLPSWIGRGLHGHRSAGAFIDIGTPQTYRAAGAFLESVRP
jgi:D-glycero-alpha-D-manno-heptose 1-phosphate guanylyltransferase